jgi:small subunit ribosomal protein S23
MGRYNFKPARVHASASQLLEAGRLKRRPPWLDAVGPNPPSQILVRTQPVQHSPSVQRRKKSKRFQSLQSFRPLPIAYEEDRLRTIFYKDHPWELARPRVILEDDGVEGPPMEWRTITPPGRQLSGER